MTVVADHAGLLPGLERAAAGRELPVLVECDTGLGRTGVQTPEAAAELAEQVARRPPLRFAGFTTYPSLPGARDFLEQSVTEATRRGLEAEIVSAGGTPTMWSAGELRPTVTEYRIGTYVFHDRMTVEAGAAGLEDVALTVCATVVSRPAPRAGDPRRGLEGALVGHVGRARPRPRARGAVVAARPAERGARLCRARRRRRARAGPAGAHRAEPRLRRREPLRRAHASSRTAPSPARWRVDRRR